MSTAYYAVPLVQWNGLLEQLKHSSAEEVCILPDKNFSLVLARTRWEAAYVPGAMLFQGLCQE